MLREYETRSLTRGEPKDAKPLPAASEWLV